ncbi:hypothetical protein [Halobacteriovorax sp. HLS]|uniref:hypothetical protein n=1 Tax=Halobacteriovorax sp. HLS TaxID=2234000 RepID=UPI0013E378AD|nr:hypothetical protein [Halobacteriovorax sp. HLS]
MNNLKFILNKFFKYTVAREGKLYKTRQDASKGHWNFDDTGLCHEDNMLRANLNKQSC